MGFNYGEQGKRDYRAGNPARKIFDAFDVTFSSEEKRRFQRQYDDGYLREAKLDEVYQSREEASEDTPYRTGKVGSGLADGLGTLIGVPVFILFVLALIFPGVRGWINKQTLAMTSGNVSSAQKVTSSVVPPLAPGTSASTQSPTLSTTTTASTPDNPSPSTQMSLAPAVDPAAPEPASAAGANAAEGGASEVSDQRPPTSIPAQSADSARDGPPPPQTQVPAGSAPSASEVVQSPSPKDEPSSASSPPGDSSSQGRYLTRVNWGRIDGSILAPAFTGPGQPQSWAMLPHFVGEHLRFSPKYVGDRFAFQCHFADIDVWATCRRPGPRNAVRFHSISMAPVEVIFIKDD